MTEPRLGGARRALTGALGDLTEGQRWTVGLALVVTFVFVMFGQRHGQLSNMPFAAAATPQVGPETPVSPPLATGATEARTSGPSRSDRPGPVVSSPALAASPATDGPVSIIAVVRPEDAEVSDVFLSDLDAVVVTVDEAADVLCEAPPDRALVLASEGLPIDISDCVVDAGGVVVSHDDRGSSAGSLSTSLGATAALVEVARVVGPEHVIGLVVPPDLEPQAGAARAVLDAEGFAVSVAVVAPDDRPGAVSAMLAFLVDGVDTVALGTSVSQQNGWLSSARSLRLPFDHLVADVADSITNEQYSEEATGLRAVAATRLTWFARDNGETEAQRRCRERAEDGGVDVAAVDDLARVYLWCQHVALAAAILEAGADPVDAVSDLSLDSPMTSPLTARTETGFGPRDVAVLEWRSGCSCWTQDSSFAARRGAS